MIKKSKVENKLKRVICLVLALIMMIPSGVFAEESNKVEYTVFSWDDYRAKLKEGIINQQDIITINFDGEMNFTNEKIIEQAVINTFNKAVAEVPKHLGELNINKNDTKFDFIINNSNEEVSGVVHSIEYINNINEINAVLAGLYQTIKTETTDYNKIKLAYDYILNELSYEYEKDNHRILDGLNDDKPVSREAYAMLFSIIMDELGYENTIITGTIKSNKEPHLWNLVKYQGNWYHVDSRIGDVNHANKDKYFLKTDAEMLNSGFFHDWDPNEIINNIVIGAIDEAEYTIRRIEVDKPLSPFRETAEYRINSAKSKLSSIKDIEIKSNLENRIKMIEKVIKAIKAVEKAETPPLKMSNVTSARKELSNINQSYQAIIDTLNSRLNKVEKNINFNELLTKAIKALEKAEKTMKETDIALAKVAIQMLQSTGESEELTDAIDRIDAIDAVIKAEKSLAKYMKDYSEENKLELEGLIDNAKEAIEKVNNINNQLNNRMAVIEYAKKAIESIEAVEDQITKETAEADIAMVTDSKIRKELEKKLKEVVSKIDLYKKIENANKAINEAKDSLRDVNTNSTDNILAVNRAEEAVKLLPSGNLKKEHQSVIKELNNAIKAKQFVETAEKKDIIKLTEKDITAAEKAISNVNYEEYIPGLKERVKELRDNLENYKALELLQKAIEAVNKAKDTKAFKDITVARKAISFLKGTEVLEVEGKTINKATLTEDIENLEIEIATDAVKYAEESAISNSKSLSKDISAAEKLVDVIRLKDEKQNLNTRIKALYSYMNAIKTLENAEKNKSKENKDAVVKSFEDFQGIVKQIDNDIYENVYKLLEKEISTRIDAIENYLETEEQKVTNAENAVKEAEDKLTYDSETNTITEPDYETMKIAQDAVNLVTDKNIRASLQKRLDAIQLVKDAKIAVTRANAYPTEKSVKDAEAALSKVDGKYSDIIQYLSEEIFKLKNQLDISKKVDEATKLVQKAVESRKSSDIINARFVVESIKDLIDDPTDENDLYDKLIKILIDLEKSIENESKEESEALAAAKEAIEKTFKEINDVNQFITGIIEGKVDEEETNKIKQAYNMIQAAKIQVINANAAVRKISDKNLTKDLLAQIDYANKEIELAEDNIDVKEAIRLVTIASSSVLNVKNEVDKSNAKLDIAAARRAIDKINHSSNKALKTTILNTINSIEKKLEQDNDQELIDLAVKAVNDAAELLAKAVRENTIRDIEVQEEIDKAIFAARLAIGWISDNNKAAKDTLTDFINQIAEMYEAEKEGIKNEERIKNAEKAVEEAEAKKGTEELDSYIRIARLKIRVIKNDSPETDAKIKELNLRLDILEGKNGGGSGGGNGGKGGSGSSGSGKGGDTTDITIIPTSPIPDSKRKIGTMEPNWGKTKELKKANPEAGISVQDLAAINIYESKLKVMELSNLLNNTSNVKIGLSVRGKSIKLDSAPLIHDKYNHSILVPVKYIGDEIGFTISLSDNPVVKGAKKLLINRFVNGISKSIIMDIGSEYCYVDGIMVKISSKPVIQNGRAYVPLDLLIEHLGLTFTYYSQNGNIQLIIN